MGDDDIIGWIGLNSNNTSASTMRAEMGLHKGFMHYILDQLHIETAFTYITYCINTTVHTSFLFNPMELSDRLDQLGRVTQHCRVHVTFIKARVRTMRSSDIYKKFFSLLTSLSSSSSSLNHAPFALATPRNNVRII